MLLIFVDETSDIKFKNYFGLCVATINHTKYSKVKTELQKILRKSHWDESIEFKGSYLFSASKGDTNVGVEERVSIAEKIIDLNVAKEYARMNFHYLRHTTEPRNHASEYLRLLPMLLKASLPKAPTGAGKNLVLIFCDQRSDVNLQHLQTAIHSVLDQKKFVVLEQPTMLTSNFNTVGILYADIIGYLAARIDNISNDAELFEGISQEQLETNGKIKKLKSSAKLIAKVKNIGKYEIKIK